MAGRHTHQGIAALRKLEESLQRDLLDQHQAAHEYAARDAPEMETWRPPLDRTYVLSYLVGWWFRLRKVVVCAGALAGIVLVGMLALWLRLGSGPIAFDIATPWLTAAIEENFGSSHRVQVGGAQIERDASGRTALRIRDITVHDSDGAVVASAPKAEVGVSGSGLLTGRVRAERLALVGAEMQVRIETDGKVTVFAGSNKRPFVTASVANTPIRGAITGPLMASAERAAPTSAPTGGRNAVPDLAAFLAWIDSLSANGLDGRDLSELGFKNGTLTVDDQRNGKKWTFHDISVSLTRPPAGGAILTVSSDTPQRPWLLRAALTTAQHGHRTVDIEMQKVPARDILLAMRLGEGQFEPDVPLTGRIHADIAADGMPRMVEGRIQVDKGFIVDGDDPTSRIAVDRAEFNLDWDSAHQALMIPFQVVSGGNRFTLVAQLDPPHDNGSAWILKITGGAVVLASAANDPNPLVLNRFLLQLRIDPEQHRVVIEKGNLGNTEINVALDGMIDYSTEPKLAIGIAANRISVAAMKRLWPAFVSPNVRAWVEDHILSGTVERLDIATNAPLHTLKASGPPVPDDGLSIEITGNGAEIRPVTGLPAIRDADMKVRISGRTATISVGRGNIDLSSNRKLVLTNGVFEVPDTQIQAPPARARFRLEGQVSAAAELLALERLREYSGAPLDPATSRGTLAAQVALNMALRPDLPVGSTQYAINLDVANLSAERLVMGHKVEAAMLRVAANNQGYSIRGDVKINGVPAALDYRKPRGDGDAEVRLVATLDDSGRSKFGFDLSAFMTGPVPVKINGRVPAGDGEGRYAIEADLTQARIDKLLPGWLKPPGRAARATLTLVTRQQSTRIDDLVIESAGASVRGAVEFNDAGDVVSANLPVFQLSDGDKAWLKAERGPDGALRVMMRGEVYDGRGFVKSALAGPSADQVRQQIKDIDLDIKLGTVAGFHGETIRNVELRMSRRGGAIRSFALNAKVGRDATILGDLRARTNGSSALYVESGDAGAVFRFTDTYPKIFGGDMWVAMDPPTGDELAPRDGILNLRDFTVRGEAALDKIVAGAAASPGTPNVQRPGVEFSRMRVEFTRMLGRIAIREGLVKGPVIGATAEGYLDYTQNDVHLRGTFVPFYGINNMFGQIPIFGLFLGGGDKEGLVGLTYEVVGPPGMPTLRVNPISVVAPGMIRKFFEFPTGSIRPSTSFADPNR